ncbi:oxioreductase [Mesoplasma florum L1]|uniref:Oxioreductase n=1 Tax=Mesoplasma florum (strain ATCC 33453 / NBRC 100688 / NCTC 11704 / L1) TaxID=265311 RepID=Q6F1Q8_MESFL|nr:Gfo/Idh/MocA family oxidoreductase [Mesoplasma florum]AAT75565.1 oxioreductase [Mesoplasma florum L1]ATI73163.1 gfo/Idh/MocA family oxidoreductase [Mesoplasma florum]ATI73850.1 gfo/Idh/MocA family oxidoreductase [Mesoplasma florum]AVN61565.1 gfo/Idh/MocA family oxidoreductase [Mesoplasma florum]AVN64950.1 gfo/Idh/MocA family oxidoreductase [Mesoplasma florum]
MKFATIGTGWIVKEFLDAAKDFAELEYSICYSRKKETALSFLNETNNTNTRILTDLNELAKSDCDFVYIASPNGLHYEQTKLLLDNHKNVILEKPATFKTQQIIELKEIANKNKVILMEATKSVHVDELKILESFIESNNVNSAIFNLNQYSSRMPDVKQGKFNSVFDFELGKGSSFDLNVYPVELAIKLFGKVSDVVAKNVRLKNNVGIMNHSILSHENGIITSITCSKNNFQSINSQIFAEDKNVEIKNITSIDEFTINNSILRVAPLNIKISKSNAMWYEVKDFINLILNKDFEKMNYWLDITIETIRVLEIIENNN